MKFLFSGLLILSILSSISGQKMNFKYFKIDDFSDRMGQTSLTDVDNDGDLDWVFGRFGDMYYYEYNSPENWILREIGKGARTDVGGCPHDVNQDGWIDFVVGDSWYENTGKPGTELFQIHKKNMIGTHDNIVVDIDGDGIKDIVSCSNHPDHPVLAWYRIPEDYNQNWDYTKIGTGIHGGISPYGYGDMDADGDMDIVRGNSWFENLDSKGKHWKEHDNLIPPGGNRPDRYGL
ncbi:MAG: FG-GAP repeat domain-containing protein, partial [Bacteroidales bacterium]